ncbi:MAG: nucleotidyltransferase [Clostridia bacterium]|nr:nucleotidyltransferase [Clostridia bacterium]
MTLFILAGGMGSRYGGLKQIDPFTEHGEFIIDFSIYDAIRAGFDRVVFLIKRENYEIFRTTVGARIEGKVKVDYVFQDMDYAVPENKIPPERVKPWGTTHAVLCGRDLLDDCFAVINADDFYGKEAFETAAQFLKHTKADSHDFAMVGYHLGNTLTENGSVARGECHGDINGMLVKISERTKLFAEDGGAYYEDENGEKVHLPASTTVSMNFWCFAPTLFEGLAEDFEQFINDPDREPMKSECLLPNTVGKMIRNGDCTVRILKTEAKWFGVTYFDDKPKVVAKIKSLIAEGIYPDGLWK